MAALIYGLCALLCGWVAWLLWRHHGRTRSRVLFWSALCFSGLTLSNLLLIADKLMVPGMDLTPLRRGMALAAILVLLYGLVYEDE